MQRVERAAQACVGRACGFAALGIVTFMFALSWSPAFCFKSGGILTLIVTLILVMKGLAARSRPYKRTEVWLILEPEERPQPEIAQTVIGTALRWTYLTFAQHTAAIAALMLFASLAVHAGQVVH
jgi:hypothetical protein